MRNFVVAKIIADFKNQKNRFITKLWILTLPKHSEFRCCKNNLKVTKNLLRNRTLDFVVAKYVRMRNFVVAKIIADFKNQKNRFITKLWILTLPKHSEFRCCKNNLKVTKNLLRNRTLDFVVAKYVRMRNFVVAKIIADFKNQKNRFITKLWILTLPKHSEFRCCKNNLKVTKNLLRNRTLDFVVAKYVRMRNFVVAKIIADFKNQKNRFIAKLWILTLPKHSEFRCCKNNLKVTKNLLRNRTLDFVVAKYVRMRNFVVAKIIAVFKNQKNRVITKLWILTLPKHSEFRCCKNNLKVTKKRVIK